MDRELLVRARAGDREAFEQIVLAKGESLFRTSLAILGNEADARDATQEAFVSAWRALPFLKDFDRFDAWMGRITINECRQALRRHIRSREVALDAAIDSALVATDTPPANATDFDAAFDRLTVDQRSMLVLHHLHGYGVDEIAVWLGIPAGTVKWRLSRARRALAAQLDEG
jgi:RNA polymerase sigma-70 factor (ECF subfamily)